MNGSQIIEMLVLLVIWMAALSTTAYYIDRKMPEIAKKSAFIAAVLSLIPVIGVLYLVYLYLTAKRRLSIKF